MIFTINTPNRQTCYLIQPRKLMLWNFKIDMNDKYKAH